MFSISCLVAYKVLFNKLVSLINELFVDIYHYEHYNYYSMLSTYFDTFVVQLVNLYILYNVLQIAPTFHFWHEVQRFPQSKDCFFFFYFIHLCNCICNVKTIDQRCKQNASRIYARPSI